MKTRGRKSAAAAEVAPIGINRIERPDAPYDLTDPQVDVWRAIVNAMAADWFGRETHDLLAQYCRHSVAALRIAQLVAAFEKSDTLDLEQYDRLLKMQDRESRALATLATKMRLTQQATYTAKSGGTAKRNRPVAGKPWER